MGAWRSSAGQVVTVLCRLEEIEPGGSKGVLPNRRGRDRVMLIRQGSRVYGYVNACPHYDGVPLGWKKDTFLNGDRTRIRCASHGALFRIDDGVCEIGPCLGQALTPVAVSVRDGQVCLDEPIEAERSDAPSAQLATTF